MDGFGAVALGASFFVAVSLEAVVFGTGALGAGALRDGALEVGAGPLLSILASSVLGCGIDPWSFILATFFRGSWAAMSSLKVTRAARFLVLRRRLASGTLVTVSLPGSLMSVLRRKSRWY